MFCMCLCIPAREREVPPFGPQCPVLTLCVEGRFYILGVLSVTLSVRVRGEKPSTHHEDMQTLLAGKLGQLEVSIYARAI